VNHPQPKGAPPPTATSILLGSGRGTPLRRANAFKLTSTQRGLLLDALACYARQIPPDLLGNLQQLIAAAEDAAYFIP